MFEALVYDERDKASDHPESSLGHYECRADAWVAIAKYLTGGLVQDVPACIYKVDVVACEVS